MHRFFLPPEDCGGPDIALSAADAAHAVRVLRLKAGDAIEVLDGAGRILECRIQSADKRAVVATVETFRHQPAPPRVVLAPALLKRRAMDLLVQQATELGAAVLSPILTDRTIVHPGEGSGPDKVAGWRRTAIEACKQCGNAWLPRIEPPVELETFLKATVSGADVCIAAMLNPAARRPRDVLRDARRDPGNVILLLGPEGDFTPREQELLLRSGVLPITLGPLVLRAETAAIAGLAVLQHELGGIIGEAGSTPASSAGS